MKNKVMKIITFAMSFIMLVSCMMLLAACQTDNELKSRNEELQNTINTLLTIDWRWNRNEGHLLVSIKHDYMNKTYTKDDFKGIKTSTIMSFSDGSYLIYLEDPAIEDLISAIVKLYDLDFVDKVEISSIDTGD